MERCVGWTAEGIPVSWRVAVVVWSSIAAVMLTPVAAAAQAGEQPAVVVPEPAATLPEPGASPADASGAVVPVEPEAAPCETLAEPTPGPVVTLDQAFELARARHPQLRSIRLELERADAMLAQAWGALLPRVSAQLMYTLNDQATVVDFASSIPIPLPEPMEPIVVRQQHIVQTQIQIAAPLFNMPILSAIDTARLAGSMAGLAEQELPPPTTVPSPRAN